VQRQGQQHRQAKAVQARWAGGVLMVMSAGRADWVNVAMDEPDREEARHKGQRDAEAAKCADQQQDAAEGRQAPHRHRRRPEE